MSTTTTALFGRFQCVCVDFVLIFLEQYGFSMSFNDFQIDSHGFSWGLMDFHRYTWIFNDIHKVYTKPIQNLDKVNENHEERNQIVPNFVRTS